MDISNLMSTLEKNNIDYFVGVPDSLLKSVCDYLYKKYGISEKHIVAPNEGVAVGLAAGYHLATKKIPCVYMQNSGIGNAVNPITSLLNTKVYAIPTLFIIGWRGEPGVKDEPQHVFQGEITLKMLNVLDIDYIVIDSDTSYTDFELTFNSMKQCFNEGQSIAIVVKKGALVNTKNKKPIQHVNNHVLQRELVIEKVIESSNPNDIVISTTGKISRELFEIRERKEQGHRNDFLTVGSMGHCSAIALSIAFEKKNKRVICIDGDGSLMMHMGSLALIGSYIPDNLLHIVLDNEAHESVGGMPTVSRNISVSKIALACGYQKAFEVSNEDELHRVLHEINNTEPILTLIHIKVKINSRQDLGRPTRTAIENKNDFMDFLEVE